MQNGNGAENEGYLSWWLPAETQGFRWKTRTSYVTGRQGRTAVENVCFAALEFPARTGYDTSPLSNGVSANVN